MTSRRTFGWKATEEMTQEGSTRHDSLPPWVDEKEENSFESTDILEIEVVVQLKVSILWPKHQ